MFEPGNKLASGGTRPGAGRPRKGQLTAAQIVQRVLNANAGKLSQRFIERSLGEDGDRVLIKAIDKLLPDEKNHEPSVTLNLNFVRFDNTVQVYAPQVSAPVLAGDAIREEPSRTSLASPGGQGQNGLKFHDFKDVP